MYYFSLILCLAMANNVMAACKFVNGASHHMDAEFLGGNITRYASDTSIKTDVVSFSTSQLETRFGVGGGQSIVECTGNEYLIFGGSSLRPQGERLRTDIGNYSAYVTHYGSNTLFYPHSGGEYVTPISNGRVTARDFGVNGLSFRTELGQEVQSATQTGAIFMTVKTSDGLLIAIFRLKQLVLTVPACLINTYDKQVSLGKVDKSAFNIIGSTANVTDFNISMTCGSTALKPSLTFEGETDSNLRDVFANPSGAIYARGVGIRLMYDNNIIIPGMSVALKPSSTAMQNYTFTASYVRTGALSNGAIEVPVTFVLTYQ